MFSHRLTLWLSSSEYYSRTWNRSVLSFRTCAKSLVIFWVCLIGIRHLVVNVEVLEFHSLHQAIGCLIHDFIHYLDNPSIRANSYEVYVLVWMVGVGPEGLGWVSRWFQSVLIFPLGFLVLQTFANRICDGHICGGFIAFAIEGYLRETLQLRRNWSRLRQ